MDTIARLTAKEPVNALERPILNIHFRSPAEIAAADLQARDVIQGLDPSNVLLHEKTPAIIQPKHVESTAKVKDLTVWGKLGKPN